MEIREILKAKGGGVATTRPDTKVLAAVSRMHVDGIGALVVSDDDKTVLGILDEREIVSAFGRHPRDLADKPVGAIMRGDVATCRPDDNVKDAMAKMTNHRVRHIPVIEGGRLAGIVSIGDIVKSRLETLELETNVLRDMTFARS